MKRIETPQEYVTRIVRGMPNGSHVKVAARARRLGYKLSAGFVHNVASGATQNPGVKTARALAAGLGRPVEEVIAVFLGNPISDEPRSDIFGVIGANFEILTPKDQREVKPLVEILAREIQRRLDG